MCLQLFLLVFPRLFCNYLRLLPLRDSEHFHCEGHFLPLPQFCEFLENKHNTPENDFENTWLWLIVMCFSELSLAALLINSGTFGLACIPPELLVETDSVTC